ncbi:putative ribonuclease H-like domain-containing protein [Tanacetum coccineum]
MWRLRIEQYFQVQDYALWDVIENGNSFKLAAQTTTNADGTSTTLIPGPVTTEEKVQKKNDVKARSMLLMALPNEHLMTFNQYKDAKTLFAAIQTRFGGNEATKKTQKTLLKQMYENFSAPSTESLDSIFNRLQKIVSQLAILGENISQEDLNLKFLRSLPSEWNTHVVVWRNKPDLDTMSFDDLYNNFKIVEQEVKGTASSSSSSQNMAFVSSPSSTNEVNTAYGVSTANTQVSPASTQVSTASTQVSTANLSDDTVYAFLASQPNGSQLVYEDLEQIHEDDIEEMDLKWQLALLSMRTRRFFQKTGRKITINGSDTAGYDKSKVECFNCHKMGHFARECRGPRNQDSRNRNQDSSRRTINVEETSSKAMLAIDGAGLFSPPTLDLSNFSLEEFQQPEFEGYTPKTSKSVSEDTSNKVRESPDALLVEELVSNDKLEKKTAFPTSKIEFVRPKRQEKLVRKPVKYAEMYRSQGNMSYLSDFKEFDEGYATFGGGAKGGKITGKGTLKLVVLKVTRKNNMYSVDIKNIVPKESLTCLIAKATLDESMLWHRRLGSKDETTGILKSFITEIENLVVKKVKIIRCDNGTKFKNRVMSEFCEKKGIKREFSVARTPQQNGDVERRNRTLIEAARTINAEKKDDEDVSKASGIDDQERPENCTQDVNTAGPSINIASTNVNTGSLNINTVSLTVSTAPLKAIHADFLGDETEVDISNITTIYPVTPNIIIHRDHSLDHVIGYVLSGVQTTRMTKTTNEQGFISAVYEEKTHEDLQNCLFACFLSQVEPKKVIQALIDPSWIEAMQDELL